MHATFAGAPVPIASAHAPRLVRWMLIGCCVGAATFASACASSTPSRTDRSSRIALRDTLTVETVERVPEPASTPAPQATAVSQLIEEALVRAGNLSRIELVRRLGLPRSTATAPIPNRYEPGRTDSVRTLTYPGLEAALYEATHTMHTFLIRLALTSRRYHSPEGLHVGMRPAQVVDRVGPPTERDPVTGELIYAESESMPTALILTVRGGRVIRITWEFYFS